MLRPPTRYDIIERRRGWNLTQAQLAHVLGVMPLVIERWENGESNSIPAFLTLALDRIDWLIQRDRPKVMAAAINNVVVCDG